MNNANMPKGRGMVKFTPFAALTAQFDGIREIIKEQHKVTHPILTTEEKERIENMLVCSLSSEEEIMITYYEDGYILSNYMTVVDIDLSNSTVICTDAFYNKMTLQFSNIIDAK
ncbi:YolD-like family protein [Bacillus thuringiensis]|uniref:3-oxoacyl-ACP synthase n=1 Tax=Bacillus thuringiensis TaxID=1428 RepID=A0A9W3XMG3_BACTU|nr:YolD-like family protein [Bacillus thuringiensis]MEB8652078.1 YolD-like family protein [Bacillus cereus]AQY42579.1 3-oxoacyl-ACP synthase [Bacillus thuringiensis]MDR4149297.1 YolD-like family protein [Bacillus thuringiensis]MEB8670930.1 YolD-like family protein [Bacillus cereus]MEC3575691.1 YolD-like family protein [Bacillus thuringiensis]